MGHAVAPFSVPAFDDSSECCLALTCHFALDVFTVMQHGLPGALVDVEAVLSAAAPDLDDDKVTTQAAAAASGAEVVLAFPLDDEVVSLSEEFFPQFFEGDTVNLAALSKAVSVSHEFLAGYVFEHGLGQPVSEIQAAAAAALEGDQLVKQAVAAREEEVSHFQKLGPLLQEKIQFFVKGDGATRVCHGQPSEPLSSVLELASSSYACHNGKCLDVGSSIEALGLFPGCTVRLYSRLRGVVRPIRHVLQQRRGQKSMQRSANPNTKQNDTIQYKNRHATTRYNTIRYNTIQYNTIQYSTVQYSTVQYITTKNYSKQYKSHTIPTNTH